MVGYKHLKSFSSDLESSIGRIMNQNQLAHGKPRLQRAGPYLEYCIYPVRIWLSRTNDAVTKLQAAAYWKHVIKEPLPEGDNWKYINA